MREWDSFSRFRFHNWHVYVCCLDEIWQDLLCVCMCSITQLCLSLCDPMDCSLPGSSVHGISQVRIQEWVAISFFKGFSQPRNRTYISCISCIGRWLLYHCTTWEAKIYYHISFKWLNLPKSNLHTFFKKPELSWFKFFWTASLWLKQTILNLSDLALEYFMFSKTIFKVILAKMCLKTF